VRAVLRFVASVLIVSGLLLLADAGATLTWQEPLSAWSASREQNTLENAFANPPARLTQRKTQRKPLKGDAIAKISIPSIGVSDYVVEGTDAGNLRKGPGHYPKTPLPGEKGTVAIAGHRTTYGAPFRRLDKLKRGDKITLDMPYGRFVYRVQGTKIVDDSDFSVLDRKPYNRLVLTACHPLYSAAQRIAGFARLVREEPSRVKQG
jgi:sortase A